MARRRKYSKKALRDAVQAYFDSITRVVEIKERVDSGKRDSYGHIIWDLVPVKNKLDEVAKMTEYLVPPTISGLCLYLGIVSSTWSRWSDKDQYPEYREIVEEVREKLLAWRMEQVVTRKDVRGLIWDMEVNHGCGKKEETVPELKVVLKGDLEKYGR